MDSLPDRPRPRQSLGNLVGSWLQWFGLARLVVTAVAVVAVGAGGYWLLRVPATPVETTLAFATTTSTTTPVVPPSTNAPTDVPTNSADAAIVVHVAGAVAAPAVYELPAGARVHDAVIAAGGTTAEADLDALNLAAALRDGDRLFVPKLGQAVPTVVLPASGAGAVGAVAGTGSGDSIAAPVNINGAPASELDQLPGIGPTTAAAIVAHREQIGPFRSVDDLLKVRGIGPAKLDVIRELVDV